MPYSLDWYIPSQILFNRYYGVMTEEDLRKSMVQIEASMKASTMPFVHVIIHVADITENLPLPTILKVMKDFPTQRGGWVLNVGTQSRITKMLISLGSQVANTRSRAVDTLDEAFQFLRDVDNTIQWEHADAAVIATSAEG